MRRCLAIALLASVLSPAAARAQQISFSPVLQAIAAEEAAKKQTQAPPPPFVYSDGYHVRLKIHKLSSFTYLPLVGAQAVLGKMIYDNPTPARRSWHKGVAFGIYGLFGVNTVTGAWNLIEGRKDPNGRTRRVIHSLLMMASDVGFLATAVSHPSSHEPDPFKYINDRSTHRNIAIASISTATVGYLIMLFK